MKKLILIVAVLFITNATYSQFFSWGLKAGLSSAKLKFDDFSGAFDASNPLNSSVKFSPSSSKMGFHIGAFTRIKILAIYLQPELYFASSGSEIDINDPALTSLKTVATVKYNKMDIPILVGFKLGPARVNLGPVASMNFSSKSDVVDAYKSAIEDYTNINNFVTWGAQVGAGVDILKKLTVDLRYEFGLSKLGDTIKIGNTNFGTDQRQNIFLLSVGYIF